MNQDPTMSNHGSPWSKVEIVDATWWFLKMDVSLNHQLFLLVFHGKPTICNGKPTVFNGKPTIFGSSLRLETHPHVATPPPQALAGTFWSFALVVGFSSQILGRYQDEKAVKRRREPRKDWVMEM